MKTFKKTNHPCDESVLAKRTKIVCTIGPASDKPAVIKEMLKMGMNVARLNFSHSTHKKHAVTLRNLRKVSRASKRPIAIIQDLQGPKIRVGKLPEKGILLKKDEQAVFTTSKSKSGKKIPVAYPYLHEDLKKGDRFLLNDGLIEVEVRKVEGKDIHTLVKSTGLLTSHKGLNLPGVGLSISAITQKDERDVMWGVKNGVDYIALSFVSHAKEVYDLKYMIKDYEKKLKIKNDFPIKVIAKIERRSAIENMDEIIEAADAVMVARGDLGIELPAEEVPLQQKNIISRCLEQAKPVIVATQMLESMVINPRPTRAEVSDVANAVIDHTDAVMLSAESATGKYPVESVQTMCKIIRKTESSVYDDLVFTSYMKKFESIDIAISRVANLLASKIQAKAILASSISGNTARLVSRYRPELPILVPCFDERVQRQLLLSWGVMPFKLPICHNLEELVDRSIGYLKKEKIGQKEDRIVLIAGEPVGQSGNINLVEIKEIK